MALQQSSSNVLEQVPLQLYVLLSKLKSKTDARDSAFSVYCMVLGFIGFPSPWCSSARGLAPFQHEPRIFTLEAL